MTTKSTPPAAETTSELISGRIPDRDAGIKAIVDLVNKAAFVEDLSLSTQELGDGLPKIIPVMFDHRPGQGLVDIKTYAEKFRIFPARRAGTAKVTTLKSFIDLVNRHKDDHSAVFAATDWPQPKLTGVINYHETGDGTPRHLDHRVEYDFPITDELRAWILGNEKFMEQSDFATFLEEHSAELASPFEGEATHFQNLFKERVATPTEVVSLSRNLEIFVGAKVKRGERLQTGEKVVEFVEEHSNGKGEKIDIPGVFIIQVLAFKDGEPVRIAARLRYRMAGGTINWFYSLYRWDQVLRDRVKADLAEVAKLTSLPTFEGNPEA
jgi:uncharacterized protein YfdQ (DUF2303 family)